MGAGSRLLYGVVGALLLAVFSTVFLDSSLQRTVALHANHGDQKKEAAATDNVGTVDPIKAEEIKSQSWYIPLGELVDTQEEVECPEGLVFIGDIRATSNAWSGATPAAMPSETETNTAMIIPRIIHMTSKSRCVTPKIANVIDKWKQAFPHYEFYLHTDAALFRLLLNKTWPEFPELRHALECANSMVEYADLWRALVVWEYGGIYTDLDNEPRTDFLNETTLTFASAATNSSQYDANALVEAFFEVERGGWLSQYFFAARPKHPLLFLLVQHVWSRLYTMPDIADQYAPFVTGPGALKNAMKHFMQTHNAAVEGRHMHHIVFEKVQDGHYVGLNNCSVSVAPKGVAVRRSVIHGKNRDYEAMNMTHFGSVKRSLSNESCFNRLYTRQWKRIERERHPLREETAEETEKRVSEQPLYMQLLDHS